MAVIASAAATLLHEGVGHGVTAWLLGDVPTELTSNHLSSLRADHWVEAGGTLVNLAVGAAALAASVRMGTRRVNPRYFLWLLGALNLLPGAGYFLFSGILGLGDWNAVISDLPYQIPLRILMTVFGVGLYVLVVWRLAIAIRPFCVLRTDYNTVGRVPYYAACIFSCAAGVLDPLGINLFFMSTVPAAFGGSSGMLWADKLMPRDEEPAVQLVVKRQPGWWIAAAILGAAYILIIGPGVKLGRS